MVNPFYVLQASLDCPGRKRSLDLFQTGGRPVFQFHAQRQAARGQHFLDLVQRLATQVRGLEQLVLGALDQIADVVDVLGLQAVGRANGQFEIIDRAQQDRINLGRLGGLGTGAVPSRSAKTDSCSISTRAA
jgi:hypothetical protein